MPTDPETYTLTLRAVHGWSTPGITRLKRALKMLGRGFGLRCINLTESVPASDATANAGNNSPHFQKDAQ